MFDYGMSLLLGGGGLMRGIKIPQQEFALKMQGGLMREVGYICGTLRYILYTVNVYKQIPIQVHVHM